MLREIKEKFIFKFNKTDVRQVDALIVHLMLSNFEFYIPRESGTDKYVIGSVYTKEEFISVLQYLKSIKIDLLESNQEELINASDNEAFIKIRNTHF